MKNVIAINTLALYVKIVVTTLVSLYTVPVLLRELGVEAYGIYVLVGGTIALLSFFNGSLAMSTQRYTSFYLGAKDYDMLKEVYRISSMLHYGLAIVILMVLLGLTSFLFSHVLNIGPAYHEVARDVYYLSLGMMFFTIVSVPLDALINSKEDLIFYAVTEMLTALMKLLFVYLLVFFEDAKLFYYCLFLLIWYVLIYLVKIGWVAKRYQEIRGAFSTCHFRKETCKEMLSFSGWNVLGASSMLVKTQGSSILLNYFFGTALNAAYGIANQLNSLLSTLSQTLLKSFAPQIVKNMGAGNRERTVALTMINCKLSLVFVVLISVPLLLELPYILKLWLGEIPEHTIVFSQLFVLLAYFNQISYGLMNIIQSQGRIRNYMLSVSGLMFLIIPITACLYLYGCPPYTVLVVSIVIEMITACVRIRFAKTLVGFPQKRYFNEVVFPSLGIFCLLFLVGWLLHYCLNEGFVRLLLVTLLSGGFNVILSYFLICSKEEKEKILSRIKK